MRWMLLACLVLSACASNGDDDDDQLEGAHLIAHITCTSDFDALLITRAQVVGALDVEVGGPTESYTWDFWTDIDGGPMTVSVTATAAGNAIASGTASNIEYIHQDDGSFLAEITLPLTP